MLIFKDCILVMLCSSVGVALHNIVIDFIDKIIDKKFKI